MQVSGCSDKVSSHLSTCLVFVSLTLFLPLLFSDGDFDGLSGSSYQQAIFSPQNVIVLYSTLTMTLPLLVDILLDVILYQKFDGSLSYRFVSVFSITLSSTVILSCQSVSHGSSVSITFYIWGYFVELCVVFTLFHRWLPLVFTLKSTCLMLLFFYGFMILQIMSCQSNAPIETLIQVYYSLLGVVFLFLLYLMLKWILLWRTRYLESKDVLKAWIKKLPYYELCALALLAGVCFGFVVFLFHIIFVNQTFPNARSLTSTDLVVIEVVRCFLALCTYSLPARLCRENILKIEKDLEVKTKFVKYISHEMRSPMSVIIQGLELADKFIANSEMQDHFLDIKTPCHAVMDILDDLILYEKIESGGIELRLQFQPPEVLVRRILADLRSPFLEVSFPDSISGNNTPILTEKEQRRLRMTVDEEKFSVVLKALVNPGLQSRSRVEVLCAYKKPQRDQTANRTTFTQSPLRGNKIIPNFSRSTKGSFEESVFFCITVTDHRSTLSARDFDLLNGDTVDFLRLAHDDGNGSGFGLFIAKHLVHIHNGTMLVHHLENSPIVVYELSFPVRIPDPDEVCVGNATAKGRRPGLLQRLLDEVSVSSRVPPRICPSDVESAIPVSTSLKDKRLNVLIVDDSSLIRKMTAKLMASLGHRSVEVNNGQEAVDIVRKTINSSGADRDFEVILMDNQMPVMLGIEATKIIREELGFEGIILGVTGNVLEGDVDAFLAHGADEVIIKPLTAAKFEAFVATSVRRQ